MKDLEPHRSTPPQPATAAHLPAAAATRTRWRIAGLLFLLAVVNFFQRSNISVAADSIMSAFHLTQVQMGAVFSAYTLGYTLFQVPAGLLADSLGPRKVLIWATISWALFTFLTGATAQLVALTGASAMTILIALRFSLGLFQSPMYPAATRAVTNWFPVGERGRANALCITGISVGAILVPLTISRLILYWGWESSFYLTAGVAFLVAAGCSLQLRDAPAQHPAANYSESGLNPTRLAAPMRTLDMRLLKAQLRSGDLWRLVLGYTLNGYLFYVFVFWFYLYLVQVRHVDSTQSAWLTTVPWVLAAFTTLGGGYLSDRLIRSKLGVNWGRRIVPMMAQVGAALCLAAGARIGNVYLASIFLALCTGLLLAVEGPYWAATNQVAETNSGFAGGLLNTGGNLGGVISPTLTPLIAQHFGWIHAFDFAGFMALLAATLWFWITPSRRVMVAADSSRDPAT